MLAQADLDNCRLTFPIWLSPVNGGNFPVQCLTQMQRQVCGYRPDTHSLVP